MKRVERLDIHLYVVGDNVVSEGMEIKKENTNNVTFVGWQISEQVATWYEACDAVIMPSRWEAFGLVAIEAMKYGKTVIVSNRGALPELVQNGINGIVFVLEKMSITLMELDRKTLLQMGNNARGIFVERFSDIKMLDSTIALYRTGTHLPFPREQSSWNYTIYPQAVVA